MQQSKYTGNIGQIRAVEDTIRATRKYTEGIMTIHKKHPDSPMQGEEFPNKYFHKHYEVYPDTELHWDMPAGVALDWLWGEVHHVIVTFEYDYRVNKASVLIQDGPTAVKELAGAIPGFSESLAIVCAGRGGPDGR